MKFFFVFLEDSEFKIFMYRKRKYKRMKGGYGGVGVIVIVLGFWEWEGRVASITEDVVFIRDGIVVLRRIKFSL